VEHHVFAVAFDLTTGFLGIPYIKDHWDGITPDGAIRTRPSFD
jgi:hypothetical protein